MSGHLTLPPNPSGVRILKDHEASRIDASGETPWRSPLKGCKTCGDRRMFVTPSNRHKQPEPGDELLTYDCDCRSQWVLHRFLLNSGIGYYYQHRAWEDLHAAPQQALEQVLEYLDHATAAIAAGRGLTLWSQSTGTGKTLTAVLALKSVLAIGQDGYFVQFNDMIDHSTDGWRNPDERKWFNRKIRKAGVLVIDDVGRENPGRSNVVESMFDSVIRDRVNSGRPTIITTNLNPDQMHQGYGGNILSLLSEVNQQIDFSGVDYRPNRNQRAMAEVRMGLSYPICIA